MAQVVKSVEFSTGDSFGKRVLHHFACIRVFSRFLWDNEDHNILCCELGIMLVSSVET